jgi:hypothetical protein
MACRTEHPTKTPRVSDDGLLIEARMIERDGLDIPIFTARRSLSPKACQKSQTDRVRPLHQLTDAGARRPAGARVLGPPETTRAWSRSSSSVLTPRAAT